MYTPMVIMTGNVIGLLVGFRKEFKWGFGTNLKKRRNKEILWEEKENSIIIFLLTIQRT